MRAVTHTDVVRAGTKDISKIFQILYDVNAVSGPGNYTYMGAVPSGSGSSVSESLKKLANATIMYPNNVEHSPSMLSHHNSINNGNGNANGNSTLSTTTLHGNMADNLSDSAIGSTFRGLNGNTLDEHSIRLGNSDAISIGSNDSADKHKDGKLFIKGHKFIDIKYRMPTYCDSCNKPLWDLFNPPAALECLSCHTKIHQEHYTNEKDSFQPCLLNDENVSARDLLLLCSTPAEQQVWIDKIRKYIPKKNPNLSASVHSQSNHSISSQNSSQKSH